ncbi:MAG TPA: NADPH-dependent FMN reductase [Pyrinomonadaceae bacterium]|jgi:NAD(P)H-dependent FMN reductase|nr:NADPH-dependent FMN reductase [Pyrinomonadaceae bacterium]
MKNILAISGSLRAKSTNLTIIENIAEMFSGQINVTIYHGLARLPHFNPDLEQSEPVAEVADFRRRIREADGVLICTPEYVFSIPGALKNALEWTVGTSDFAGKPTALITASSLGEKTHESLFLVLKTIEAKISERTALLISGARSKVNSEGKLSDAATIEAINLLIESFLRTIDE